MTQPAGFSCWYLPAQPSKTEAAAAAVNWLRQYPGVSRAARSAPFRKVQLLYVPIWEHRCVIAGWEIGQRKTLRLETRPEPGRPFGVSNISFSPLLGEEPDYLELVLSDEPVRQGYLQERRRYQEAVDLASLGLVRPLMSGRELLVPMLAGEIEPEATVLEPSELGYKTAQAGLHAALCPLSEGEQIQTFFFALRESLSLIYWPVYLVEFAVPRGRCFVAVDGRDGTINSACAPSSKLRKWARTAARLFGGGSYSPGEGGSYASGEVTYHDVFHG
ncbi:MAG: hypothetical protein N3B14_03240 [Thermoleophilia bacterium]|nr:hypothetical protein [Thermoleophilia bacterium]